MHFEACSKIFDKEDSCESNPDAQTLVHDGETREYVIYVPSTYDENIAHPVLLNFHGYGGNAGQYMHEADMRLLAESEKFILVYPQGACLSGSPHWNAGLESEDNKSDSDDFGFAESLINELSSNYNVDTTRVYACGYSNGAMFAYALACFKSNLIAAVGSVSGTMLEETIAQGNPDHPLAMINLHGTSDNVLPYIGDAGYASIPEIVDFWVTHNETSTTPAIDSDNFNGTTIQRQMYNDGLEGVSVAHYMVAGGDHVWFNLEFQGSNTGQLIWDFVSQYDLEGRR